ncbi:MAG: cysteine hydrolase [Proteobacteria bacterium]|nr:cysteine hydrolase [Pseudomonadota bacterium]
MAHDVEIRPEIKERVRRRRGRLHFYERLDPARTAHVVIDMQNVFVAPGAPIEVPEARGVVERINETNRALRALGVKIVWVTHRNLRHDGRSDWALYYDHVMTPERASNLLISGTKTNVCCESTARDAMMLDFRTVMLSDCTAAQTDDEHRTTLENMITQFADVMTAAQALLVLKGNPLNE